MLHSTGLQDPCRLHPVTPVQPSVAKDHTILFIGRAGLQSAGLDERCSAHAGEKRGLPGPRRGAPGGVAIPRAVREMVLYTWLAPEHLSLTVPALRLLSQRTPPPPPRAHHVTRGSCTLPQAYLQRNFGADCVPVPYIIYSDETHVTLHGAKFHSVNISLALPGLHRAEHGYQRVALLPVIEPEDFKMTSGDLRRVH